LIPHFFIEIVAFIFRRAQIFVQFQQASFSLFRFGLNSFFVLLPRFP